MEEDKFNPYDDLVRPPEYKNNLRRSMLNGLEKTPEEHKPLYDLSKKTGKPTQVVQANQKELEKQDKFESLDLPSIEKNHQGVAKVLENPDDAIMAQDDIENLKQIDEFYRRRREADDMNFLEYGGRMAVGRAASLAGGILTQVDEIGAMWSPVGVKAPMMEDIDAVGRNIRDWAEEFSPQSMYGAQNVERVWKDDNSSIGDVVASVLQFGLETSVQSLPDMLAMLNPVTTVPYVLGFNADLAEERAENQGRDSANLTDSISTLPFSIGSALLERIGAKGAIRDPAEAFQEALKRMSDEVIKDGAGDAITRIGKATGKGIFEESWTEAIQSGVLEYTAPRIGTDVDMELGEAIEQALWGALGGGLAGGMLSGSISTGAEIARAMNTDAKNKMIKGLGDQNQIELLSKIAKETKLNTLDKKSFNQMIKKIEEAYGEEVELYINIDDLMADVDPQELEQAAQDNPTLKALLDQALDDTMNDGEATISIADYMTDIIDGPLADQVREHVRIDSEGMSKKELKNLPKEHSEKVQSIIEFAETNNRKTYEEASELVKDYTRQLVETGTIPAQQARVNAKLLTSFITTMAINEDITIQEAADRMGLVSIVGPEANIDEEFTTEDGFRFDQDFDESVVTEEVQVDGTGETVTIEYDAGKVWNESKQRADIGRELVRCLIA